MYSNWSYSPETPDLGQDRRFFVPCDLEIWRMTLKNYRAPLLYYVKLYLSFQSHWLIQTWVTVRKRSIRVKIDHFCLVWPSNLMDDLEKQYFKAIGVFKLELQLRNSQFGNAWFGSKSNFFRRVALKFGGWPSKTIFYATSSFVYHFIAIGEFKLQSQSGNDQSGSNSTIFRAVWPWKLTDDLEKQ